MAYFSNSLLITPLNQMIDLKAGETVTGSLTIANPANSTEAMEYSVTVLPYGVTGEDYAVDFSSDTVYNDIVEWIKLDKTTGVIAPNDTATVNYTITVPADAPAGGQYCAIVVRNDNGGKVAATVQEIVEIASVIYGKVEGEVREEGEIMSASAPTILFTPPMTSSALFKNTGNVHLNAKIHTEIKNALTGAMIYEKDVRDDVIETIMPGTQRFVNYNYEGMPKLGVVQFTQKINFGGYVKDINQTVFICPIWFMLLVAVTAVAIMWGIVRGIKKNRKRKARYL